MIRPMLLPLSLGRRPRRAALALAFLAVPLAVGACGGSSKRQATVSPDAYVSQVCTSVGTWLRTVESGSSQIERELKPGATPAAAKQALEGLMQATVASSERAVAGLRAAGAPDVAEGKSISARLLGAFERATSELASARRQVASLPTASASAFRSSAQALAASLRSSVSGIGSGLSELHSATLEQAAARSAACRSLGAG